MAEVFDLLYGEPGSAKTRSIIARIKKMYEETGKIARAYVGDGSLSLYNSSGLISAGVVVPVGYVYRPYPFSVCQQMCEGMWPKDVDDPKSAFRQLTKEEVAKTGMWIFEGGAVMGEYMLGDMTGGLAQRGADLQGQLGQDSNVRFTDPVKGKDGEDMSFAGNSPAHYGTMQRHLKQNVLRTQAFPGIVYWTSHERYDDGERGGSFTKGDGKEKYKMVDKIIGPDFGGKSQASNISREFGNTLHFTVAGKKVQDGTDTVTGKTTYKEGREYRIYTSDHFDPDGLVGVKYRAVARAIDPTKIKPYYTSPASDPGRGLLEFYADLEQANKL